MQDSVFLHNGQNNMFSCHFRNRDLRRIETSPLICSANKWTGFYMTRISVMKELNRACNLRAQEHLISLLVVLPFPGDFILFQWLFYFFDFIIWNCFIQRFKCFEFFTFFGIPVFVYNFCNTSLLQFMIVSMACHFWLT